MVIDVAPAKMHADRGGGLRDEHAHVGRGVGPHPDHAVGVGQLHEIGVRELGAVAPTPGLVEVARHVAVRVVVEDERDHVDDRELLANRGRSGRQHDDRARTCPAHLAEKVQTHFFQVGEVVLKRDLDAEFFQVREQLVPARVAPEVDALWAAG